MNQQGKQRHLSAPFHPQTAMEISDEQEVFLYLSFYGVKRSNILKKTT